MVTTNGNDDPPEFPDEISTSSKKAKHCFSLQPCQILEELLYEIFLRLPVKSLIRFRCLSKGMRIMIDSSIFIKNHNIHRSVKSERDRSLSDSDSDSNEESAIFLYQPSLQRLFSVSFDKEDNNNLNHAKPIELKLNFAKEGMVAMGWCCNGIFCFRNCYPDPTSYLFWNPTNGTFRKVDCSSCLTSSTVSMGYDYVNDDYKITRFIDRKDDLSMDVYSFRKDSWRKFPRDFPSRSGRYGLTRGVCVRGVMHWFWTNRPDRSIFIAAFDLATETFTSLPLPLEARQLQLKPSHFTDFRGRLCITFLPPGYPSSIPGGLQTIWVMEKYGVGSSWTKLYNFDHDIINFYFPNSRRRLLCKLRWLSWWDPEDGSFERIEMNPELLNDEAFLPELYFYDAYVYVRNLIRLDQSLV